MADSPKSPASPGLRMAIDFGPLAIFFLVNMLMGGPQLTRVLAATSAFMVAIFVAMGVSYWKAGHISPMLWVSGALVLVFGSLTLYYHDATFIKIKPTIVYTMFAIVLAFGLITGRPLLQAVLGTAYPGLSAKGWRLLTINWTIFFVAMAVLNEVIWRVTAPGPTDDMTKWAAFKLWGVVPLTLVFAMLNIPLLMKHGLQLGGPEDVPVPPEG
jgi:intracellular septation protein